MKKAGINWLVYGIESYDLNVRKEIGKPIKSNVEEIVKITREHGIYVVAIIFLDYQRIILKL